MIPLFAQIAIHHESFHLRLWLPLFLIWLLLLPLVLIFLPFVIVGFALTGLRPFRAIAAMLSVLCSLPGTSIDVDHPSGLVFIRIV